MTDAPTPGPWLDPETLNWLHEPQRLLTNPTNARMMGFAPETVHALTAAYNALRSYQHGNGSPDLAQRIADHCVEVLTRAGCAP